MRIAVIGAGGQLGSDLCRILGADAVAVSHGREPGAIELTEPTSVREALNGARPEAVINLAAYNLVDRAEDEPEVAFAVNAFGPRSVARWCGERDVPLVHVSTDYVFGLDAGRSAPYRESDLPGPVSVYGASKLAGEHFVQSLCRRHLVVRTCGLYGPAGARGKGGNFVQTMLRLGRAQVEARGRGEAFTPLRVVHDQTCTPTCTRHVATAIAGLVRSEAHGLYHVTNAGACTWYEFAREIFRLADLDVEVQPITSEEFVAMNAGRTIARRPAYSVLDCSRYLSLGSVPLPSWQEALGEFLRGLGGGSSRSAGE